MRLPAFALLPTLLCFTPACNDSSDDGGTGDDGGLQAFVSDWEDVVETKFVAVDGDDEEEVTELFIGGLERDNNFVNRGDIEVYYTEDENIRIRARKFLIAETEEEAKERFDKFFFWAWARDPSSPKDLEDADPEGESKCSDDHWVDGCNVRAWYEGQTQPERLGMDFQVWLPKGWAGKLVVTTEDNLAEGEEYPDRGDITIKGASGPVEVNGEGGVVRISRPEGLSEALNCPESDFKKCQDSNWAEPGTQSCPCDTFGTIKVTMEHAANVFVSLNNPLMMTQVFMSNNQDGLSPNSTPLCEADFDCSGMEECDQGAIDDRDQEWKLMHQANVPEDAQKGIGFNVSIDVNACVDQDYVESASDFGEPKTEARGFMYICAKDGDTCSAISEP